MIWVVRSGLTGKRGRILRSCSVSHDSFWSFSRDASGAATEAGKGRAEPECQQETFVQPSQAAHRAYGRRHLVVSTTGCRIRSPYGFRITLNAGRRLLTIENTTRVNSDIRGTSEISCTSLTAAVRRRRPADSSPWWRCEPERPWSPVHVEVAYCSSTGVSRSVAAAEAHNPTPVSSAFRWMTGSAPGRGCSHLQRW